MAKEENLPFFKAYPRIPFAGLSGLTHHLVEETPAEKEGLPMQISAQNRRLVIVSNRLPVVLKKDNNGQWSVAPGSGGLVTAMAPVLQNRGGMWIGWPGTAQTEDLDLEDLFRDSGRSGYILKPVALSENEVAGFYYGFANEILWPLFHDLQTRCNFNPLYWQIYQQVNRKFADVIADNLAQDDHIWVHDYHLLLVAEKLRALNFESKIGYFLHIPFPPLDLFVKLPWRMEILRALLNYDLIGFQTLRDRRNFLQCLGALVKEVQIRGKGQVVSGTFRGREVRIGNFPISIDFNEFSEKAKSKEVTEHALRIRKGFEGQKIVLGVDRLDYSKGIPERLVAFENALKRFPELSGNLTLFQVVVPSRVNIPKYMELKLEIERLVSRINGQFSRNGWVPIHYVFRSLPRPELLAYYRTAQIALITPLKDGMNLVAKEYCAASVENANGVLILSEFAGAASQLQNDALLVNPHDVEGVADAIFKAHTMSPKERQARMSKLRRVIRSRDIYWWVDSFLRAVFAHDLEDFPTLDNYVPPYEIG